MKALYTKTMVSLLGAAMVSTAVVGCGGSGGGSVPPTNSVAVNGGISTGTATAPSTVDASTTPVPVTLPDGTTLNVFGDVINPGDVLVTLPDNLGFLNNLFLDDGRAQGDINVKVGKPNNANAYTKIGTTTNTASGAKIIKGFGFKAGKDYTINWTGPFVLTSGTQRLHIQNIVLYFNTTTAGASTMPSNISGSVPSDGGSLNGADQNGLSFALNQQTPGWAGTNFRLVILKANGNKTQVQQAVGKTGLSSFTDLTLDGNDAIPTTGIQTLELDYYATAF